MTAIIALIASLASGTFTQASATSRSDDEPNSIREVISTGVGGRFGVGCTRVNLPFSGTLVMKGKGFPGQKRPLRDAELWAYEHGDKPRLLPERSDVDGAFSATVTGWDEVFYSAKSSGKIKLKHSEARVLVKVAATGCEDRWVHVDRAWKNRTLVLKCHEQP